MKITDITGQIILQQTLIGENSQVDVSAFAAGSYFILLTSDNKQSVFHFIHN
jgi:hypothetical protein